jgi:hypothetical protein
MLVDSFNSLLAVFAQLCLLYQEVAAKPHCTVAITENLPASISTFSHMPNYR